MANEEAMSDNPRPWERGEALAAGQAEPDELEKLCKRWRVPRPWGPYRAAPYTCYDCGERVVVYTWFGHGEVDPPRPRPRIVKRRGRRGADGLCPWSSVCPKCGAPFLFRFLFEQDVKLQRAPFRGLWSWRPILPGDLLMQESMEDPAVNQDRVGGGR